MARGDSPQLMLNQTRKVFFSCQSASTPFKQRSSQKMSPNAMSNMTRLSAQRYVHDGRRKTEDGKPINDTSAAIRVLHKADFTERNMEI
jgi:hypothetical protein